VVVATGPFQAPRIPALAAAVDPDVVQLHSATYRNPAQLPAGGCAPAAATWSSAPAPPRCAAAASPSGPG
jgi:putative flavoprotein involved in K+ transport